MGFFDYDENDRSLYHLDLNGDGRKDYCDDCIYEEMNRTNSSYDVDDEDDEDDEFEDDKKYENHFDVDDEDDEEEEEERRSLWEDNDDLDNDGWDDDLE